ncbi:hypothetical protein F7734_43270 [Scytonema sp. UIC 10036]|uniref:hypothetical protein n=1 Tax=Scytonema sp. UIC 10036 TaxID=2304196 RepID=UPI0012DA9B7F|nr:hypothetical protein [Scytonema sp. UIC 10036]MUG98755.1 hypothetical protein [Scytonema sp. UIC 10036]
MPEIVTITILGFTISLTSQLVAGIIASAITVGVVVLTIIKWDDIIEWFKTRNRMELTEKDTENIRVLIKTQLESGEFVVIKGIFNKREEILVDSEVNKAGQLDEKVAQLDNNKLIVIEEA